MFLENKWVLRPPTSSPKSSTELESISKIHFFFFGFGIKNWGSSD